MRADASATKSVSRQAHRITGTVRAALSLGDRPSVASASRWAGSIKVVIPV
jgi:hypothetical protein